MDIISVVEAVRARRDDVFVGFGVGRVEKRGARRGRMSSISDGESGTERGERRVDVREVRRRVVWVRWVVREVWEVIKLAIFGVSVLCL